jgi:hypothetical protein
MGMSTTIQLRPSTQNRLALQKQTPRKTFAGILTTMLDLLPTGDGEGVYRAHFRAGLHTARLELPGGRTVRHDELKRRLDL